MSDNAQLVYPLLTLVNEKPLHGYFLDSEEIPHHYSGSTLFVKRKKIFRPKIQKLN